METDTRLAWAIAVQSEGVWIQLISNLATVTVLEFLLKHTVAFKEPSEAPEAKSLTILWKSLPRLQKEHMYANEHLDRKKTFGYLEGYWNQVGPW